MRFLRCHYLIVLQFKTILALFWIHATKKYLHYVICFLTILKKTLLTGATVNGRLVEKTAVFHFTETFRCSFSLETHKNKTESSRENQKHLPSSLNSLKHNEQHQVKLLLSSRLEMEKIITKARVDLERKQSGGVFLLLVVLKV